jgi:hypothetical protein
MEVDKNPMPEFKLFDPLAPIKWLGRVAREAVTMHQLASHGDHFQNTGGGPALDKALYDNPMRPIYEVHDDGVTSPSTYSELFEPKHETSP